MQKFSITAEISTKVAGGGATFCVHPVDAELVDRIVTKRFVPIHGFDGQTDRQTDGQTYLRSPIPRLHTMERVKNNLYRTKLIQNTKYEKMAEAIVC